MRVLASLSTSERVSPTAKLTFYGAAGTVTGACFLVEAGNSRVLVDCGLFQGSKEVKERNYLPFAFNPASVDFLLLTHAHIDHSGLIPKLYRHGFRGRVLATAATCDLCQVLLPDSAHVQEMEVERKNRKLQRSGRPLLQAIYTAEEAYHCQRLFQPVEYHRVLGLTSEVRACFYDAGHILGSASIKLWIKDGGEEITLLFSGDLGRAGQPLMNDPRPPEGADFVVLESTYGARHHPPEGDGLARLAEVIRETHRRGGNVLIPAFAVERTQDVLYALARLMQSGALDPGQVYLDSPLAVAATEIFCRYLTQMDEETQLMAVDWGGTCPFLLPGLKLARTCEESMAINRVQRGAVIIAASGMCDAGRIKHHLKHNLWRPECTVVLVGYQAEGTLGRRLEEGATEVTIHGEPVAVRARIEKLEDFSAHADQEGLVGWVKGMRCRPQVVFLTHGEAEALSALGRRLQEELGVRTYAPAWKEQVELSLAALGEAVPCSVELADGTAAGMPSEAEDVASPSLQQLENEFNLLKGELETWHRELVKAGRYQAAWQRLRHLRRELHSA
ncbi:MAG: MBL fold metallo-hydrolase RNA specificity domain-containing protein [Moorellales bacterium]